MWDHTGKNQQPETMQGLCSACRRALLRRAVPHGLQDGESRPTLSGLLRTIAHPPRVLAAALWLAEALVGRWLEPFREARHPVGQAERAHPRLPQRTPADRGSARG
ncbi:MAG TPA: hypothetical protein VGF67_03380, partial [Ktedonobacteraceae bacterium]